MVSTILRKEYMNIWVMVENVSMLFSGSASDLGYRPKPLGSPQRDKQADIFHGHADLRPTAFTNQTGSQRRPRRSRYLRKPPTAAVASTSAARIAFKTLSRAFIFIQIRTDNKRAMALYTCVDKADEK